MARAAGHFLSTLSMFKPLYCLECLQIAALSVLNNLDMVEQAVAASASASASTVLPQSGRLLLNNGRVTLDFANM